MVTVHLDNTHSVGLGDNVCLLSALAKLPDPVELVTTNDHNTYNRLVQLKNIFQIPDTSLTISPTTINGSFPNTGWPLKIFTEYYKAPTRKDKYRPCIALACFFETPPPNNNEWPWCKQRPLEFWSRIFLWLKSLDYEVITVDRHFFDLEDKVDVLVNQCDAIISYEGGMAHLCHSLGIPCFLIDWKHPSPSTKLGEFHCEFVHRTRNVHILRDDSFLSWSRDTFDTVKNKLKAGKTNNRLVNGECGIAFELPSISSPIAIYRDSEKIQSVPGIIGDQSEAGKLLWNYYKTLNYENT